MVRRPALLAALAVALVLVAPAAGDNSQKIQRLHEQAAAAHQREAALNAQIADVTTKIRTLERQVGDVSQRLTVLEHDLELHQERLARLNDLFRFETQRLHFLQHQYAAAVSELDRRVVQLYESPKPSVAEVIFDSGSVQEAIDTVHYLEAIAAQDKRITTAVQTARNDVHATREHTKKVRVYAGEDVEGTSSDAVDEMRTRPPSPTNSVSRVSGCDAAAELCTQIGVA